jgi:hypothetical protein
MRLSGGRTWWAHFEFTRINIEPTILRKKIEDAREVSATLETLRRYTLPIVVRLGVRDVRNWWLIRNV